MAYDTLDAMHEDLGRVVQPKRITYRLLGEIQYSEVVARGVNPDSCYAEQMGDDAVCAGGLLFDRNTFHGHGTVLIDTVENA